MVAVTEAKLTSAWDTARHGDKGWPLFLTSVEISGLRGWSGEMIEFRYPVVAIAGTNGAGKSTILKAAAAAYRAPSGSSALSYSPDDFFPKTPWEHVGGVLLRYTLRQGAKTETSTVRKPTSRWKGAPERKQRPCFFLDISRIQPANTQIGYGRKAQEVISRGTAQDFDSNQLKQLNRTLGRKYEQARIEKSANKQIGVLTQAGVEYSNFHQGAGEDSVLDLLALVASAPDRSLIVIDEVEASLHPQAQRGLITELLEIAEEKRLQIILSTHSPYILEQLPPVARMFVSVDRAGKRDVLYGVTPDFALNLMDDERHDELDIYCEDEEAKYLVEQLLSLGSADSLKRVKITPVGPAATVVLLAGIAAADKLPRAGFCVLDADQAAGADYITLPGTEAPEKELFAALSDPQWGLVAALLRRSEGEVLDARDHAIQVANHHAWTGRMSKLLGGTLRPSKIWEAISDIWVQDVVGEAAAIKWARAIEDKLEAGA
ncbi:MULTISPECIES: AAA family ATPase [unclassified Frigoribacterium]|uniref:ATP-dependent nuclease n=1 Tax=unclassified Frigoribacterium TaxID=2627005 RepID=UPI0015653A3D